MSEIRDALHLAHGHLTQQVIGGFYDVYNELGAGFVESVYTRALQIALAARGIAAEREAPLRVRYREIVVGDFRADLLVQQLVIVELKTCDKIQPPHERQLRNYLRASGLSVGLILNVGDTPGVKRLIWTAERPCTETRG